MLKNIIRPASNILIASDLDTTIIYKAHCACLDDHDIHTLVLEYDREMDDISMILYANLSIDDYHGPYKNFILRMLWRLKYSLKVLFTGRIEMEGSYLFVNEQAVHDYIKALEYGLGKMTTYKYRLRDTLYIDELTTSVARAVRNHKWEKNKKKR